MEAKPASRPRFAQESEAWLRTQGVKIVAHPLYGRADLVARKDGVGTFVVEVEGDASRQREQAMYSALGQIVLSMHDASPEIAYALAMPDGEKWAAQLRKVPDRVLKVLRLRLWLVSETSVRCVGDETDSIA
jgi:hypothetical protein